MNILQRIRFSSSPATRALYAEDSGRCRIGQGALEVSPRTAIDLDTFFNALVVGPNGWPPEVGRITCELRVRGDMEARLVLRDAKGLEHAAEIFQETSPGVLQYSFDPSAVSPCRYFVRIATGDVGGTVFGGTFSCDAPMQRISPAVVFCTYRREVDIVRNVRTLFEDEDLMRSGLLVYVADNGRTLAPEALPRGAVLLPGPNEGGAGGFNRGIREAVRQGATHIMLMDDDVAFDSEAVFRCLAHYGLGQDHTAIAGVLLEEDTSTMVQEAGAWLSGASSPFVVQVGNNRTDLVDASGLDALYATAEPEYGGFWFFAFPAAAVQCVGLIAPFFLKADDIEFCLRLRQNGLALQLLSGVGVQHPGFTSDFSMVKRYYWIRNMLNVEALHGGRTGLQVAYAVLREVLKEWRRQRPHFSAPLTMGTEDFLEGPRALEAFDNASMLARLNTLGNTLGQNGRQEGSSCVWRQCRYGLRGIIASARLAVRYAVLKKRWLGWQPPHLD